MERLVISLTLKKTQAPHPGMEWKKISEMWDKRAHFYVSGTMFRYKMSNRWKKNPQYETWNIFFGQF